MSYGNKHFIFSVFVYCIIMYFLNTYFIKNIYFATCVFIAIPVVYGLLRITQPNDFMRVGKNEIVSKIK